MRIWQPVIVIGIVALMIAGAQMVGDATSTEKPAQQGIQQFEGTWHAVAVQHADGSPAMTEEVAATRLVVTGNRFTLINKQVNISGTFAVNATRTPKTIDVVLKTADGPDITLLGIYAVKGNVRKSCFALPGKDRPTRFMTGETGYVGFTWAPN